MSYTGGQLSSTILDTHPFTFSHLRTEIQEKVFHEGEFHTKIALNSFKCLLEG